MPYAVAITQSSWLNALRQHEYIPEANFWRPGSKAISTTLIDSFMIFVRKGKLPRKVMGYAKIKGFEQLPIREAWERWGVYNGLSSLQEFTEKVKRVATATATNGGGLRNEIRDAESVIGCIVLTDIILFPEEVAPVTEEIWPNFPVNVVGYKIYPEHFPERLRGVLEWRTLQFKGSSDQGTTFPPAAASREDAPTSPRQTEGDYVVQSNSQARYSLARNVWEEKAHSNPLFFLWIVDASTGDPGRAYRIPSTVISNEVIHRIGWQDGSRIYIQLSRKSDRISFISNKNPARRKPQTSEHSVHLGAAAYRIPIDEAPQDPTHGDVELAETPGPASDHANAGHRQRSYRAQHVDFERLRQENQDLGLLGEHFVLAEEKRILQLAGRQDLALLVEHTSDVHGDGAGYDIRSYSADGLPKYVEVKTTAGPETRPFLMSANELAFAKEHHDKYWIYRVYDFRGVPQVKRIPATRLSDLIFEPVQFRVRF